MVSAMELAKGGDWIKSSCLGCAKGKQQIVTFGSVDHPQSTRILDLLHTDIVGPLCRTIHGERYILTFIDDFSRMSWVFLLQE
jgi:hypothetical protein